MIAVNDTEINFIASVLTAKILIINELQKDSVVKLHKTEDFWVYKLHKMDCF